VHLNATAMLITSRDAIDNPDLSGGCCSPPILTSTMPTVVFANRKGGVGKTLSTL
jgi:hypothetical protein